MYTKKIGDLATYINGYAFKPSDWGESGLPIVRIQDLTGTSYQTNYYDGDYPKKIEINNGDVLISWSASLGVYVWDRGKALLNQHIFKVVFDKEYIDKNYFVYAIKHSLNKMTLKTHGATMKHIVKNDFYNIEIPYPNRETQIKMSKALLKVENVIEYRKQQLEQFDLLIKSRFVEMFGDVDLTMNKNEWIEIKHIGTVVSGATPKTIINEYWNGDFNWFTPAELSNNSGYIFESERKISQEGVDSCSLQKLPVNTVLLTSRAPIGKLAIAGTECYCNQGFKNIICGTKVLPRYLYYLLLFNTEFLNSLGRGATFKEISKSIVENIKIPLPPIELQNEFAQFVEQVEETKTQVQKSLDEAQLLFNSLMQEYFG